MEKESRGAPARPFFVVITITPFDARDPYCAAAEASFSTSMDAMSSGSRFGFSSRYIPSTT